MKGNVFEIKRFAVHDGDGIRTTVFFKGCPLRCLWCHNPEGLTQKKQLAFYEHKCVGCAECVKVCPSGAHRLSEGAHVFEREKCTACGACVKACPKNIIELRNKGRRNMRVFVSCVNKDKGAVARKACKAACIGCGKCAKVCPFEAITVENNVAYIDFTKCKLCKKCVAECPTGAIHAVNFPVVKPKPEAAPAPKPAEAPAAETVKKEE